MTSQRLNTFSVWAKLNLDVSIEIKAESLEDAVVRSKELKEHDFVEFLGDFNDGDMKITGVFESE